MLGYPDDDFAVRFTGKLREIERMDVRFSFSVWHVTRSSTLSPETPKLQSKTLKLFRVLDRISKPYVPQTPRTLNRQTVKTSSGLPPKRRAVRRLEPGTTDRKLRRILRSPDLGLRV